MQSQLSEVKMMTACHQRAVHLPVTAKVVEKSWHMIPWLLMVQMRHHAMIN
jgi:hypothetical protein